MPHTTTLNVPTHYEVLQLPSNTKDTTLSKQDVKAAYHRALLLHHPDKAPTLAASKCQSSLIKSVYSVDQIAVAFRILSDPTSRSKYDKSLLLDGMSEKEKGFVGSAVHTGVDVFDLEDLAYEDASQTWHHSCRCGDQQGYVLTEPELERESHHGEIYVGCNGCSLWIKVVFGTAAQDEGEILHHRTS